MGIQRFGSRMKGYAKHSVLGRTDGTYNTSVAIIDGPGLAHHIYYSLCETASVITYQECADATIGWLKRLQQHGFKLDAILFDGALPISKKDVRLSRLQGYIGRLHAFKQSSGAKIFSVSGEFKKSLPPPPFLVFAIVEELLGSPFAGVTYVVPGEADPYCVAAAQTLALVEQITIFSDDADLIVYEASQNTRIVPFRDLCETRTGDRSMLKGDEYRPWEIVKRSNSAAKDLISAAFFMSRDLHCSLDKAFRMTVEADAGSQAEFQEFARGFEIGEEVQQLGIIRTDSALKQQMTSRDSRVSELLHQLQLQLQPQSAQQDGSGLRMYLPFISDDPSRGTAWNVATEVRVMAYTVLLQDQDAEESVQEYRRSGSRVASTLVETLSFSHLAEQLDKFAHELKTPMTDTRLEAADAWRFFAMKLVVDYSQRACYSLPALGDAVHIVMNRDPRKWHLVHLSAQYQAAFYSLRMLKQMLAFTHGKLETTTGSKSTDMIRGHLSALPTISAFFDDQKGTADRKQEQEDWHDVLQSLIPPPPVADAEESRGVKRRRKGKQKSESASVAQNPFAVLAD